MNCWDGDEGFPSLRRRGQGRLTMMDAAHCTNLTLSLSFVRRGNPGPRPAAMDLISRMENREPGTGNGKPASPSASGLSCPLPRVFSAWERVG